MSNEIAITQFCRSEAAEWMITMGMPVIKPGTNTREESVADIISSIAAEETAIAHVLNAESEKLQAITNMADVTPEDLLLANSSVQRTVDSIIQLELALKSKLAIFSKTICQTN